MARMLLFFPLRSRGSTREEMMETAEWHVENREAELRQWGERLSKLVATAEPSGAAGGTGACDAYKGAVEDAWRELAVASTKLAN
jgi:hypothetical protein